MKAAAKQKKLGLVMKSAASEDRLGTKVGGLLYGPTARHGWYIQWGPY